jgi:hypothetical protein
MTNVLLANDACVAKLIVINDANVATTKAWMKRHGIPILP